MNGYRACELRRTPAASPRFPGRATRIDRQNIPDAVEGTVANAAPCDSRDARSLRVPSFLRNELSRRIRLCEFFNAAKRRPSKENVLHFKRSDRIGVAFGRPCKGPPELLSSVVVERVDKKGGLIDGEPFLQGDDAKAFVEGLPRSHAFRRCRAQGSSCGRRVAALRVDAAETTQSR